MSETGSKQRTIQLTKLENTSHYRLWRVATKAIFDVYNVLNIVLGKVIKPTFKSTVIDSSPDSAINIAAKITDWERRHKLACEALCSALKPAQLIRVAHLQLAHEIWQRLANECGRISDLKRAHFDTKLPSLRKSSSTSMQSHVDEFERIKGEIEFHSESMKPGDINIVFLLSLGDSETWKNFRNSNLHWASKLKPSDLFAEVILIDEANITNITSTSQYSELARALITTFNHDGNQNKQKRPSFHRQDICEYCQMQGHIVEDYPKICRFCHEHGHLIEHCFKQRWVNEQRFSKRRSNDNSNGNRQIQYYIAIMIFE